jgi:protein-S-isoprenylcysteine O-methyltransferase Ste14
LYPFVLTGRAETVVFIAACLIWAVPEMIGSVRQRARVSRKGASVQDRSSLAVVIGLQWIGLALCFFFARLFPAAAISGQRTAVLLLGILIMLMGVALRWYAIRTLGRFFTRDVAVSADQPVVQDGPYRFIRHPAYSGTFLSMLGLGLAVTTWAGLVCLLACVFFGHLYRVNVEEKALVGAIGQPYVEYMRRTRRFIPLLF